MDDCFITLLPFSVLDHERVFRTKTGPQQRIKVSASSTLASIASYILNLSVTPRGPDTYVKLYVENGAGRLSLPLSLSVGEFLSIANRGKEGALYYFFAEEHTQNPEPIPAADLRIVNPSIHSTPVYPPVYHSGISMFSNSFGRSLPNHDSRGDAGLIADEGTVDLRRHLEALLSASSIE
jgi:hypothetical protein